jgi:hypothetical protein
MTENEVTVMLAEAIDQDKEYKSWHISTKHLMTFAKLVAAKEREACAEVCKKHADVYAKLEQNPTAKSAWAACIDNRDTIRARGQA